MSRVLALVGAACLFLAASATPSYAWHLKGNVFCDGNQNGLVDATDAPMAGVRILVTSTDGTFSGEAITDATGFYVMDLPDFGNSYTVTLDGTSLPAGSIVLSPSGGSQLVSNFDFSVPNVVFLVQSPVCVEARCWLTGGGAKFNPTTGTMMAEHGPKHSFGGNVNPGCNTDSGEGGQWNHIAHALKLHFQGWQIQVVRCGNIEDPNVPPGSESPVTPFNFIEFRGTGTLKGIQGNKVDHGTVEFFARAEDRNEPGSSGAKDGADIDRYFLHVWNAAAANLLLIDIDGDPTTIDPVTITHGNLQIHISSCETTAP
ncbi:MAG: carboxypeptidase-like regulatory domain-containing protein [Vicinamibacterales bacterium]